jgi:hypothetical protein
VNPRLELTARLQVVSTAAAPPCSPRRLALGRVGKAACSSVFWVEAGDDLELGTVPEHEAAHHVDLPQLHETVPLPATEVLPALAPTSEIDQPVALEAPVDARARRNGTHPALASWRSMRRGSAVRPPCW